MGTVKTKRCAFCTQLLTQLYEAFQGQSYIRGFKFNVAGVFFKKWQEYEETDAEVSEKLLGLPVRLHPLFWIWVSVLHLGPHWRWLSAKQAVKERGCVKNNWISGLFWITCDTISDFRGVQLKTLFVGLEIANNMSQIWENNNHADLWDLRLYRDFMILVLKHHNTHATHLHRGYTIIFMLLKSP